MKLCHVHACYICQLTGPRCRKFFKHFSKMVLNLLYYKVNKKKYIESPYECIDDCYLEKTLEIMKKKNTFSY